MNSKVSDVLGNIQRRNAQPHSQQTLTVVKLSNCVLCAEKELTSLVNLDTTASLISPMYFGFVKKVVG